jgi:tRNA-modifying protein YgfZ
MDLFPQDELPGYEAARADVAIARLARDVLAVSGPDAMEYLQGQVTQDVLDLAVGDSRWSFVLQPQGKVDALFRMTRTGPDSAVLDVDAGWGAALHASLERFKLRTRMQIEPLVWSLLALRGPGASPVAGSARGAELEASLAGLGEPGMDLLGPEPEMDGVALLGPAGWEALRVENGVPGMGSEIDQGTIPNETGLMDVTVSFSKGCYRGQELVERIHSRGVSRLRLAGIVCDATAEPSPGEQLHLAEPSLSAEPDEAAVSAQTTEHTISEQPARGSRAIGHLTSAVWSPTLQRPVALAYVRGEIEAGSEVVSAGGWTGVVAALPLVDGSAGADR